MTRDLRKYTRQTHTRLIIGGILLLFIVGDGLILIIYGREAALMGFVCLLAGLLPLTLIWIFLWGMEMIVKASDRE
jgi:hypothetical protein